MGDTPASRSAGVGLPAPASTHAKMPAPYSAGEQAQVQEARGARQSWEASPEGQARTTNISQQMKAQHGITATAGQIYDDYRRSGIIKPQTGVRHYDTQLPGMADPHAAPRPPKWEELPEAARAHTLRRLGTEGMSIDQMTSDFGAQVDQGVMRQLARGADTPYASTFYNKGSAQRNRLESSAAQEGLPVAVHAQMNAFTSPNTKFEQRDSQTREMTYPNDEAAVHAIRLSRMGVDPAAIKSHGELREMRKTGVRPEDDPRRVQGYPKNMEKAQQATHQFDQGIAPADWKTGEDAGPMGDATRPNKKTDKPEPLGGSPWRNSPKTGPYANSWSDTHPQFLVSDVHTGGGGFIPHEGSSKALKGGEYDSGLQKREKSSREDLIASIPFFHSASDYSARQAMGQRGMSSVRETQATQWGEEQIQRSEGGARGLPSETEAYSGVRHTKRGTPNPGQGTLFS